MRLQASIVVPLGPQEVWDFLAEPRNSPKWDRSVAEVVPHSTGPVGVGWEATTIAPSGKRQDFRITRFVPAEELAFVLLESPLFKRAELVFRITAAPRGTRIDHVIDLVPRAVPAPMIWAVLRLTNRRALATDLDLLRTALVGS